MSAEASVAGPRRARRGAGAALGGVAARVLLWGYAAVALAPLVLMAVSSLRPEAELRADPLGLPTIPEFGNYARAWTEADFGGYFANSVFVTVTAVLLGTAVSVLAAYALGRYTFPGSGLLLIYLLAGLMIPIRLGIVPVFYLFDMLGLLDSLWGLVLVYAASGVPFGVFVLTAFFRQLPAGLAEAARIDGAGEFRLFGQIMLPLVRPALATVMLFQFIQLWNDFFFPLVLIRDQDRYTLPVGLTAFFTEYGLNQSLLYAGLVITTLPLVLLFLLATRQVVDGLTAGVNR
ncbi:carbohydrate ABC transporter permease [Marinitenerispora sediminis]|uniref:Carbohydrate ABC transporter permease n=1 Tax=Marinitenerispora sediminis TaxID=1931232 RepID=A0A368TC12_9ACTN|nr:carbohydrate ABC transporter permease [Marinitenerispora sediminis]RCV51688.1 carbohydrate ABC transporter permease [Marinitenerispora sediminis]RCV58145.1 carbohydrate ABC transporter permease [Marinitenerispora sediminis]RCV62516.1 carbohydrate ABC transporter permease [Marinitenerispora sediminis]